MCSDTFYSVLVAGCLYNVPVCFLWVCVDCLGGCFYCLYSLYVFVSFLFFSGLVADRSFFFAACLLLFSSLLPACCLPVCSVSVFSLSLFPSLSFVLSCLPACLLACLLACCFPLPCCRHAAFLFFAACLLFTRLLCSPLLFYTFLYYALLS